MCVMEIHPGQHTATMVQAMLHNTRTVISDMEMLLPVLDARSEVGLTEELGAAEDHLREALDQFLHCYRTAVEEGVERGDFHLNDEHGSERVSDADEELIVEAMHIHAHRAEAYETR